MVALLGSDRLRRRLPHDLAVKRINRLLGARGRVDRAIGCLKFLGSPLNILRIGPVRASGGRSIPTGLPCGDSLAPAIVDADHSKTAIITVRNLLRWGPPIGSSQNRASARTMTVIMIACESMLPLHFG